MTLGEFLNCLGDSIQACAVHFSERGGPAMILTPPFSEPDPDAIPYLDSPCSGFSFRYDPCSGTPFTVYVLLASRPAAPALDVPID